MRGCPGHQPPVKHTEKHLSRSHAHTQGADLQNILSRGVFLSGQTGLGVGHASP